MKICNKKMEYAHMELNGKMFLISAEEFSLYDKYLQFVLACIKSFQIEGLKLTKDNWRKYIDKKDMLEAAERAVFVQ